MSNCCKGTSLLKNSCTKDEINADFCDQSASIPSSCVANPSCCEEQSHCEQIVNQEFYAAVKIQNAWNMPDCGETSTLVVPGLKAIAIGSYLWKSDIGYLEVISFSASRMVIVVRNNCQAGNAAAGTEIPACSVFTVTVPPADAQPPLFFPYVAIDFTAPANGDCLDITVTSVNGLQSGKKVQIGTGFYRLEAIVSPTVITICNDGDGITPGTAVIAQDGAQNYQYPIVLIDSNFCSNTASDELVIIGCDGNAQVPLESDINGSTSPELVIVPALIAGSKTVVRHTPIDAGIRDCTKLTAALGIVNGDPTYQLLVDSSAAFAINDVLEMEGRSERFTVTATGAGTIDVTAVPTPGANATVPVGSWVCKVLCCESVNTDLTTIEGDITTLQGDVVAINNNKVELLDQVGELSITNTAAESDIYNFTLPAAVLGAVRLTMGFSFLNNTGGAAIIVVRAYLGTTIVLGGQLNAGFLTNADPYSCKLTLQMGDKGAPNVQYAQGMFIQSLEPYSRNSGNLPAITFANVGTSMGDSAEDATTALPIRVTVQMNAASAALQSIREFATLELLNG